MTEVKKRFMAKVQMDGNACWLWQGGVNNKGYGLFYYLGSMRSAPRASYLLFNGEIPDKSLDVCHTCDTPACVNPGHLFLGSRQANMLDAVFKGRMPQMRKTHCPKGHEYTKENTLVFTRGRNGRQARKCQACDIIRRTKNKERINDRG
jgi:hypothetical protein